MCTYFVIGCEKEKNEQFTYIYAETEVGVSCWVEAVGVSGLSRPQVEAIGVSWWIHPEVHVVGVSWWIRFWCCKQKRVWDRQDFIS